MYRLGNAEGNKIDVIRNRAIEEIEFYRCRGVVSKVPTGQPGEVHWVKGGPGGGISLFDDIETAPIIGKYWYRIPKNEKIPTGLGICDSKKRTGKATHYQIYPTVDMPLDNFKLLLRQIAESVNVNPMFIKVIHPV